MQSAAVSLLVATELVAPLHGLIVNEAGHEIGLAKEVGWPDQKWKRDCFKRVPVHGLLQVDNPGAGMVPEKIVPYQTVLKDGFMKVGCVKDAMYEHGDRFGNNKFQYKMGPIANSSIVHYTDIVPGEDRKPMTKAVCFEFCRGIPDMGFFGISNGRDCYCTPFYKAMASDSSQCDSVCEGDKTLDCGGRIKNSIFSMHSCDSAVEDMKKAIEAAAAVEHHMENVCGTMFDVSKSVEHASTKMQKTFGMIGDPYTSDQMQLANEYAGTWLHKAEKCLHLASSIQSMVDPWQGNATQLEGADYDVRKAAEDAIKEMKAASKKGTDMLKKAAEAWQKVQPSLGSAERQASTFLPNVLEQYKSLMYFVDDEAGGDQSTRFLAHRSPQYADDEKFPVTCDGDLIGEPALGLDAGHCAAACDENVGECVGFAAYELHEPDETHVLCFLFSKIKTATYFTGCDTTPNAFLQKKHRHNHTDSITGWHTLHRHDKVHVNFTAHDMAECAKKRASTTCSEAKQAISTDGTDEGACYLTPNNKWVFEDLPGYFDCLGACCQDYDPNLILDGLTCDDLFGFYGSSATACPLALEVSKPPPDTLIQTICPESCKLCDGPVAVATTSTTTTPAPPIPTKEPLVVTTVTAPNSQPTPNTEIKAMCRAKFSKFGSASLKPDPSGKNQYALKKLIKADRCLI